MTLSGLAYHLVQDKLLTPTTAIKAVQEAKTLNLPLIRYLVKHSILTSADILQSFATHYQLPVLHLDPHFKPDMNQAILSAELMQLHRVILLGKENHTIKLAISDPTNHTALNAIRFHTSCTLSLNLISEEILENIIEKYFSPIPFKKNLALLNQISPEETLSIPREKNIDEDEPLIQFANNLIKNAIQQSASDIHIEPQRDHYRIRYRQDGILQKITEIPMQSGARLIARLKVLAKLDIAERRLPQDGRFHLHHIDIRLSTCPTLFGEKIVLRLLDTHHTALDIETLGFTEDQRQVFLQKISQPQGLILVAGPTGSGKTVTLYSALQHLNTLQKNISTAEDPIEIQLSGINQVNINPKIGLHFSTILKTFLRQDPDILMVGEIRDQETAEIAIQAAQTGHLVFSTIHANNVYESLVRLQSMGIPTYHLLHSIALLISQRLVRKLCVHCKQLNMISAADLIELGFHLDHANAIDIYRAANCAECNQGYQGRTGIFELLPITEDITQLENIHHKKISSLRQIGFEKIKSGITSIAELNRVIV